MDILYLVGNKSSCDFWDLRFSLRSIEKYGINIGRVFMCGYIPEFISKEVIKIPFEIILSRTIGDKARNIYKQIIYATINSDIGINDNGNFLISMDDHYILKETDFSEEKYPRYVKDYIRRQCRHYLPIKFEKNKVSPQYQKFLVNTALYLRSIKKSYLNFTLHRNMRVNRYIIEELEENGINKAIFDNKIDIEGICLLCNYEYTKSPFKYTITLDFKNNNINNLNNFIITGGQFYSTQDFQIDDTLYNKLFELFPNKCKYEYI